MKWTVRRRLMLSYLLLVVLMAVIGGFSVYNLNRLNASTQAILQKNQPVLTDMAAIESNVLFHSLKVEQYVTTGNRAHLRAVDELRSDVEARLSDLESRTKGTEDESLAQEIKQAYATYVSLSEEMRDFYQRNPDDAASIAGRQMRIGALLENSLLAQAETLYESRQDKIQELVQTNTRLYRIYLRATVAASLVLTVLAISLSVLISRSITVPIDKLVKATQEVAGGDLAARAEVERRDEMGLLAEAFNAMAKRLRGLIDTLELRVAERTRELGQRTAYLEASAEVSRATSSILDPDQLIQQAVDLIRARFDLYYVGLFLVDEMGKWAVLRAGTGEAGRQMLREGHKLEVGGRSMIGQCVAQGDARIALDVGEEAVHFDNPLLPKTRSEAALPLRSRGRVLGAVTVQSTQPAAFDEDVITVLQTMADQVAVALDNARLFAESEEALEIERRAYGEISREAWTSIVRTQGDWGYYCDQSGVALSQGSWSPEMRQAVRDGRLVLVDNGSAPAVAIPIQVRGHTVGALGFQREDEDQTWTEDEVGMLEKMAEQLSQALESARLYQDTQRRAAREQLVGQMTASFARSLDIDAVLRAAVEELGQLPNVAEAAVHVVSPETPPSSGGGREVEREGDPPRHPGPSLGAGEEPAEGPSPEPSVSGPKDQGSDKGQKEVDL